MLISLVKNHLLTINLVRLMAYRQIQQVFNSLNHSYSLDEIDAEWQKTWNLLIKNRRYGQAIYESPDLPGMTIIVKDDQVKFEIDALVGPYIWWSTPKSPLLSKTVVDKVRRSGFIRKYPHVLLLASLAEESKKAKAKAKAKEKTKAKSKANATNEKNKEEEVSSESEFLEVVDD